MANKYLDNDGLLYLWQKIKNTFAKTSDIPTKTSELSNDSGYITNADIPESVSASTTTPLMNGTAAVGTSNAFARGDHIHPSDTSKVSTTRTIAGHALTSDVTLDKNDVGLGNVDNTSDLNKPISTATQTALDNKIDKETGYGLASVESATSTIYSQIGMTGNDFGLIAGRKDNGTISYQKMLNENGVGTIMTLINTTISEKANADSVYTKNEVYTKTEMDTAMNGALTTVQGMINSAVANMYKYKGSVATISLLPSSGNTAGDVYNVESSGMNYAWNGTAWDSLGQIFTITAISNGDIDTIIAS